MWLVSSRSNIFTANCVMRIPLLEHKTLSSSARGDGTTHALWIGLCGEFIPNMILICARNHGVLPEMTLARITGVLVAKAFWRVSMLPAMTIGLNPRSLWSVSPAFPSHTHSYSKMGCGESLALCRQRSLFPLPVRGLRMRCAA